MNAPPPDPTKWHRKPTEAVGPCPICGIPDKKPGEHRAVAQPEVLDALWIKRRKTRDGWQEVPCGSDYVPTATEWHYKPSGFDGPCPVCAIEHGNPGSHRAVGDDEGFDARWMLRRKSGAGWRYQSYGSRKPADESLDQTPRVGMTREIMQSLAMDARLAAQGFRVEEIAEKLGTNPKTIENRRCENRGFWEARHAEAMRDTVEAVREVAGTDGILADVPRFVAMASAASHWLENKGEQLFPHGDGSMTLRRFYQECYARNMMAPDASAAYREQFEIALRRWEILTGDPPVEKIDSDLLTRFRDALMDCPGLKPGSKLTAVSVKNYLIYVERLLTYAGPPGPRVRGAAGLIDRVPWTRPPRPMRRTPRTVDLDLLGRIYEAAGKMRTPDLDGINPGDWWQSLIAVAYNTGLRKRTLFSIEWVDVDLESAIIDVPPERMKTRRGQVVHLNQVALDHLRRIERDAGLVFPWPHNPHTFFRRFAYVQDLAGVPRRDQIGLQTLRRTCATQVTQALAPGERAAQRSLGHSRPTTTRRHYINHETTTALALDAMEQPAEFTAPRPRVFPGDGEGQRREAG